MTLLFEMPGTAGWVIIFAAFGVLIIPQIFYLMTMQSAFAAIAPENRTLPPSQVWLRLIPLFGLVWSFVIVSNLERSIQAEEKARGVQFASAKPSYNLGLAMCILSCFFFIPFVNFLACIAAVICWIVYWVAVASFKSRLTMANVREQAPSPE